MTTETKERIITNLALSMGVTKDSLISNNSEYVKKALAEIEKNKQERKLIIEGEQE